MCVCVYSETGGEKERFSSLIRHRDALFGGPQSDDAERRYQIGVQSRKAERRSLFHITHCYDVRFVRARAIIYDVRLPANSFKPM